MRRCRNARPMRSGHRDRGIVLAIVLVLIFALVTAVYAFQRRAIVDATIGRNRMDAMEADALARGGLRIAEALLMVVRAKYLGGEAGGNDEDRDAPPGLAALAGGGTGGVDALWQGIGRTPIRFEDERSLRIEIEDEGIKLNLNALVPPLGLPEVGGDEDEREAAGSDADREDDDGQSNASEEAVEYLTEVLDYIVDGMDRAEDSAAYDSEAIAENLLDFIDGDTTAVNGRNEDEYYRRQDPPYRAWNRPYVSVDQIGLVEGVDPPLLEALRRYVTVHPIASTSGINLNRAEPWVLKLAYSGTSGNRRLLDDKMVEDLYKLRSGGKLVCDDAGSDPRCVTRADVGNGDLANGSVYPPAALPAKPSVFRVVTTATVGDLTRRLEAIYDTRPPAGPQLLSWRRLRGVD